MKFKIGHLVTLSPAGRHIRKLQGLTGYIVELGKDVDTFVVEWGRERERIVNHGRDLERSDPFQIRGPEK